MPGYLGAATSGGGGGGVNATTAIRLYERALKQAYDKNGKLTNPDAYVEARETYLAPYADNLQISLKIADSVNAENALRTKLSDEDFYTANFKSTINSSIRNLAKTYYKDSTNLIVTTATVYTAAVEELQNEIDKRKAAGDSVGALEDLMRSYATQQNALSNLSQYAVSGIKPKNQGAYGVFIQTNPDTGEIMNIDINAADSINSKPGYTKTNQLYGDVPVYLNTANDKDGNEVARIGDNTFKIKEEENDNGNTRKILKKESNYGGWYSNVDAKLGGILPGGIDRSTAKKTKETLNLSNIRFGYAMDLPIGSVAKDGKNNYYYKGQDGSFYKATSKDNLKKFLDVSGAEPMDLDSNVFPVGDDDVSRFGSFTSPDGTSRIIDDKTLGITGNTSLNTSASLPSLDQDVSGTIKTGPLPQEAVKTPETSAFQVPRKTPGIKTESQIGSPTIKDTMASQVEKMSPTNPVAGLFKNIFG